MIVDAWLVIAQGSDGLDESDGSVGANASYRFDGLDGLDNAGDLMVQMIHVSEKLMDQMDLMV